MAGDYHPHHHHPTHHDPFEEISDHRRYSRSGFNRGYALGEEAGWKEGFLFGLKKGADLATEIGFYEGYTTGWLTLLEKQDQSKARKIQALRSLQEMARAFPIEEQLLTTSTAVAESSSLGPKLSKIRAKYRQVQALLLSDGGSRPSTTSSVPPGTTTSGGGGGGIHLHPHHLHPSSTTGGTIPPHPFTSSPAAAQQWINRQIFSTSHGGGVGGSRPLSSSGGSTEMSF